MPKKIMKKKSYAQLVKELQRANRTAKQLQGQLDKSESERIDWHRSYMKEHKHNLEYEQMVHHSKIERAEFLEHWYAVSSEVLADQRARRKGPPKGWTVQVNVAEARDGEKQ